MDTIFNGLSGWGKMGSPDAYGLSATTAHEVLGQSIVFSAFVAVGELLARTLKRWFSVAEVQENELAALLMAA